jgi:hypothetical protein
MSAQDMSSSTSVQYKLSAAEQLGASCHA